VGSIACGARPVEPLWKKHTWQAWRSSIDYGSPRERDHWPSRRTSSSGFLERQFQFGVEAGVPLTNTLSGTQSQPYTRDAYSSKTKRLLIGPTCVSVGLPGRFRIELEALYQRINYDHTFVAPADSGAIFSHNTADRWQFPLLLQYRFKIRLIKPFVEAGPSFSDISNYVEHFTQVVPSLGYVSPDGKGNALAELRNHLVPGVSAGLGVDFHPAFFHIQPVIRYTRWATSQFSGISEFADFDFFDVPPALRVTAPSLSSKRDQLDFAIGVTF
jgi:hypothetical protein